MVHVLCHVARERVTSTQRYKGSASVFSVTVLLKDLRKTETYAHI